MATHQDADQLEENREVVRRIAGAMSAGGDLDALDVLDGLVADDYVEHNPAFPADRRGPDALKRFAGSFLSAFPDLELVEDDVVAEGDRVVYRHRAVGTHEGEFMGIEPTGEQVEIEGIAIYRIEDGRAAEKWLVMDALGLMRQLGAVPESLPA